MKTLEFKLSFTAAQQQRVDDWLLIQKWIWNRGLGLIEEFGLWNVWNKHDKKYYQASPACYHDPETKQMIYGKPMDWKLAEGLVENRKKQMVHPIRVASGQPMLTEISYFSLLNLFAQKWHKDRVISYGDRSVKFDDCPSKFVAGAVETLANAYKAFLEGVRKFPKFKRAKDSCDTLINNNSKDVKIKGDKINIPKLGWVTVKGLSQRWPENLPFCPLKICRKGSGYYLQLTGEIPEKTKTPKFAKPIKSVGLDPGNNFVYSDDAGHQVTPPEYFKKSAGKLARLQRKMARQFKANSHEYQVKVFGKNITVRRPNADWQRKNYKKVTQKVKKLHEKISRQRRAFNHFHSTKLVNCYDQIFLENFQTKNLGEQNKSVEAGETINKCGETVKVYKQNGRKRKRGMIKKMRDNATGQLWAMIEQKAKDKSKIAFRVSAHYTSQTCPNCGNIKPKKLSERIHSCKVCGYEAPRDVAAAQVIKKRGLEMLARNGGCTEENGKKKRQKAGKSKDATTLNNEGIRASSTA
ncbi:RNA-guided endonuclease TnpB family protein [Floridanema evergladense]|uniref:RNA-guided endonuclease TnpB family protein n=1 Tax=Floridaenema evergladense BLCC-F167 TaxID=3153639 RepID=A0ABV4WD35_9CYAN